MKKYFVFAAAALVALAACKKTDGGETKPTVPEVKTAKENLVAHFGFEAGETVATGITLDKNYGAASTSAAGYIGKGWSNTKADNAEVAYTKYNVAANALNGMTDVTFTAWVKNNADKYKGAILSLNGSGIDWPAFIAYFDNKNEVEGVTAQQVNGRLTFWDNGADVNLWLSTSDAAFAKYGTWYQFAFTYKASTGEWALYVDGVRVGEVRNFDPKLAFNKLVTANSNAIYVGGWASRIEGTSTADWQSYFAGSIDEIRLYNKALTEAEIQALRKEEVAIALL